MSIPQTHSEDALKLTGDGIVYLYEITIPAHSIIFRFKDNNTVTWQGNTYEGIPCQIQGVGDTADDSENRPTLRIYNPAGIFNAPALDGSLYRSIVTRKRVLLEHIENDVNIYMQRMWYVERPKELISGQYIALDLRAMTEGPNFQIPVRQYMPPEFPMVSL